MIEFSADIQTSCVAIALLFFIFGFGMGYMCGRIRDGECDD